MRILKITRHSGHALKTLYLDALEMSASRLAMDLGLQRERISGW
ncbi:MAG: hypothetical protein AAGA87_05625 [Pseudomonadota bacterium]